MHGLLYADYHYNYLLHLLIHVHEFMVPGGYKRFDHFAIISQMEMMGKSDHHAIYDQIYIVKHMLYMPSQSSTILKNMFYMELCKMEHKKKIGGEC